MSCYAHFLYSFIYVHNFIYNFLITRRRDGANKHLQLPKPASAGLHIIIIEAELRSPTPPGAMWCARYTIYASFHIILFT